MSENQGGMTGDENDPSMTWQPPEIAEQIVDMAKTAGSAINGVADAIGITPKVEASPYAMVAGALAAGYVLGGGLFTPTTARLLRLGAKLAAIPQVRDRLLDVAESAVDTVLSKTSPK
jgi:hypothetical protein